MNDGKRDLSYCHFRFLSCFLYPLTSRTDLWYYLSKMFLQASSLGAAHILPGRDSMAIKRGKGDLIELSQGKSERLPAAGS